MAQSNQVLNQNLKDLENFPKIYKSLEIKMKEKCENLKGINADIQETEINLINGKNKSKLDYYGICLEIVLFFNLKKPICYRVKISPWSH